MSWDAYLKCVCCESVIYETNFTHNCNGMANAVIDENYEQRPVFEEVFGVQHPEHSSWWAQLNGLSGLKGAEFLDFIIKGLEANPAKYEAMNPANGWGSYKRFLEVLREMRGHIPEYPTIWKVYG